MRTPLLARFYHLKKDLLKPEPIMIGPKKVVFRSKLEHAVDMILELAAAFHDAPVLVVCDSWFGNNSLLRPLRNALDVRCHLLTRLRSNAAIFDTTPPRSGRRGRPLDSYDTFLNYLRTTTTTTGLRVQAHLVTKSYKKGVRITDRQMRQLRIARDEALPKWNYTLHPG